MNKYFLVSIMLIVILIFSGCSMKNEHKIDQFTKQKNITKIQNDVSEIMGKSYKYVIDNIGDPYITTYYSNEKDCLNFKSLDKEKILQNIDIEMVYPKDIYESSALYIYISKGRVVNVESDELIDLDSRFKNLNSESIKSNIILDFYNGRSFLDKDKINLNLLKSYNAKYIEKLKKNNILENPNAILYLKDKNQFIRYYVLEDKNKENSIILSIHYKNNKIINIKQIYDITAIKKLINT